MNFTWNALEKNKSIEFDQFHRFDFNMLGIKGSAENMVLIVMCGIIG